MATTTDPRSGDTRPTPDAGFVPSALACRAVLVPLDGSPRSERALGPATWLADRLDAEVHAIAAVVARDEAWWYERYLDELAARYPATTHRSADPDVAHAVAAAADVLGPSVVCAATHGRSRRAAVVGSTFLAIARRSPAPVVAVGERAGVPISASLPILACVDGSSASEAILPDAAAWAKRLDSHLTLATVAEGIGPSASHDFGPDKPEAYLEALLDRPELDDVSADGEVLYHPVSPHEAIAERLTRRPAALVALTSHARTGLARMVMGSEAAKIIQHSPVPVLVHPNTGHTTTTAR